MTDKEKNKRSNLIDNLSNSEITYEKLVKILENQSFTHFTELKKELEKFTGKKLLYLTALAATLGFVQKAASMAGVTRMTLVNWRRADKEFEKLENYIRNDFVIQWVESKLYEKIAKGDTTAILFFLKTRAKDKYQEQPQVAINQNFSITANPVEFVEGVSDVDFEELEGDKKTTALPET